MAIFANFVGTDGQSLPSQGAWEYAQGSGADFFIQSNTARAASISAELCVRRTEASFPADQYAEVTFATAPTAVNSCMGPAVRVSGTSGAYLITESGDRIVTESGDALFTGALPSAGFLLTENGDRIVTESGDAIVTGSGGTPDGSYYGIYSDPVGCYLFKYVGGVYTQLAATGPPWVDGDVIRLTVTGTSLVTTRNGSPSGMPSATDADLVDGKPGIAAYNDAVSGTMASLVSFGSTDAVGLTVNLTGAAMALAAGTVVRTYSTALTGAALTAALGTATAARALLLPGQLAAFTPGAVTRAAPLNIALTGASLAAVLGSLAPSLVRTIGGGAMAFAPGSLGIGAGVTGLPMGSGAGQLAAGLTLALTGLVVSTGLGSLGTAATVPVLGASAALAAGTVAFGGAVFALIGQPATVSRGSIGVDRARALTGSSSTAAPGTVAASVPANIVVGLTGATLGIAQGSLGLTRQGALAGAAITSAAGVLVRDAAFTLSGSGVTASGASIAGQTRSAALAGQLLAAQGGLPFTARTLSPLTGAALAAAIGSVASSRAVQLAGTSMALGIGSVTFSETEAPPLTGAAMAFAPGILRVVIYIPPPEFPVRTLEGAPASWNSRAHVLAGAGALVAGPNDAALGRFGWADARGRVSSSRQAPTDRQGFTLAQAGPWSRVYYQFGRWWLRSGFPITMMARGEFWARFEGGAVIGQRVYARLLDGAALSGYAPDAEATPYYVARSCEPGALTVISTWSTFPQ